MNNQTEEKMMIENEIDLKENKEEQIQQENVEVKDEEEEQEDVEQKERDQKIEKRLNEINDDYLQIMERVEIHQNIIQQISQCEESKQIESTQQLKFSKKSFLENQIKLEKLLLSIDSLVGASPKMRPQKKKVVNQIQKAITQIDQLLEQLKTIENKVELIQKQQKEKREQEMREEQKEQDNTQQMTDEENTIQQKEEKEKEKDNQQIEGDKKENQQIICDQHQEKQEKKTNETKPSQPHSQNNGSFQQKLEKEIEQENKQQKEFPFPSKEQWEMLEFDPKFNIEQLQNKYLLSSKIANLNIEDIKVNIQQNILKIEGVKYPNEQEKQILIKRLIQSVNHPHILNRFTSNQIISAILKIASQYNFGKFSVKYELPSNFDSSQNIEATYKNGILQIELPIRNKNRQNFFSDPYFRREVPFYGHQQTRRSPNNFWDFF